jgi:uncharacterized protein YoxC
MISTPIMKTLTLFLTLSALASAETTEDLAQQVATHQEGSQKLASRQDELAADVQQMVIEQTQPKIIELLESVEGAMDDASGMLTDSKTGGETIAAQTDVIEKIFAAAQEKQKQQGKGGQKPDKGKGEGEGEGEKGEGKGEGEGKGGQGQGQGQGEPNDTGGAMLEMMRQMMGQGEPSEEPGKKPGKGEGGKEGGEGQTGESDTANSPNNGTASGTKSEERRVPKASGKAGKGLPSEFQRALDSYNRDAEKLTK